MSYGKCYTIDGKQPPTDADADAFHDERQTEYNDARTNNNISERNAWRKDLHAFNEGIEGAGIGGFGAVGDKINIKKQVNVMTRLNVFATAEEIEHIKHAVSMPFIRIGGHTPESPQEACNKLALQHGLPEIKGYYGCDLSNGEFVSI